MKRQFASRDAAKRAHRRASFRLRIYYCEDCRALHVTNADKRHDGKRT